MVKDKYQKRRERKEAKANNTEISNNKTNINWYPGHMAKTKREIKEKIDLIDIVYEIIDARMPKSSKVVDLDLYIKNKPKIIIITKYDLCDQEITNKFIKDYEKNNVVIKCDLKNYDKQLNKKILETTDKLLHSLNESRIAKGLSRRKYRALVVGSPNVGKSTLINRLAGKNVTETANKAGVTKNLSWIRLNNEIELLDSPGILWPNIEDPTISYNLASLSSIKEEILNMEDVSSYIIKFLYHNYPAILESKYGLKEINESDLTETFAFIARKRGALLKGNNIDYDKVYMLIINDLKEGKIGKVTFDIYK